MSYYFKHHESLNEGLRRIGTEQLQKALEKLRDEDLALDERIHAARKHGKKVRALLRLLRPGMESIYKKENANIRDACRLLSSLRDYDAMLENLAKIIEQEEDTAVTSALEKMRDALEEWIATQREEIDPASLINETCDMFESSLKRAAKWKVKSKPKEALYAGIKKTYKRGRKAMRKAYDKPTGDNFHEWRKRVKYHRYHIRLLRHAWRPLLNPLRKELHVASNFLGEEHDLTVMLAYLEKISGGLLPVEDADICRGYFEKRQVMLRDEIHALGLRTFCEKPKRLAERLKEYYTIWVCSYSVCQK